jgi:hypothetical protein
MKNSAYFSIDAPVEHGRTIQQKGYLVGYAAIINSFDLQMPMPNQIALVSTKNKKIISAEWIIMPSSHLPEDNEELTKIQALYNHLVFSLKYEGVNLLAFAKLTETLTKNEILELVNIEPTGQYSRRIWFLIEWITEKKIVGKADLQKKSYVPVIDEKLQFAISGVKSPRHLILNNLPGNVLFCPLIKRTEKLEKHLAINYAEMNTRSIAGTRKDIIQRASAFLLLKDSKASFTIEGESPKSKRTIRWGNAIGQAGLRDLNKDELIRLQQLVIENSRFIQMGFRTQGGFIGEHDRDTGEPIPDHISARHEDLDKLIEGLIATNNLLINSDINPVLAAAKIAFGFVFMHPFEDGNGRIHRYLIHHLLAKKHFSDQGIVFPISSSILDHIDDYRIVLESYSRPLLDFIEWEETNNHNVKVTNNTLNYYRFFDATQQAEFLFDCVNDTIKNIIPKEITYLSHYDEFKKYLEEEFEMPDKMIALLVRFLETNNGVFSKRAKEKEFMNLANEEIKKIETEYNRIFSEYNGEV